MRSLICPLLFLISGLFHSCGTVLEPRADLAPSAAGPWSDADWATVLREHVDDSGRVDYRRLQAAPEALERYYARLAASSPDRDPNRFPSRADRLAYWINGYNAAVMVSVLRAYPISSVEDLAPGWHLFFLPDLAGFFYLRQPVFGGEAIDLHGVENDIVRERFADPRIHFALNCASRGCPRLPREPFRAEALNAQLDREARRFFAEARNLEIDDAARVIHLSPILDWYQDDFLSWLAHRGETDPQLLDYVAQYVDAATGARLRGAGRGYAIRFRDYDWALNDAASSR